MSLNKTKPIMIRDSFTFPNSDYELIDKTRLRLAQMGSITNKGEIIRAGLIAMTDLTDDELMELSKRVVRLKPGRK